MTSLVKDVMIIEPDSTGHRLAYVAAIASAASEFTSVKLVTTAVASSSPEFQVHLSLLVESGRLEVMLLDIRPTSRTFVGLLRKARRSNSVVVIPEADRLLWLILFALLFRRAPTLTVPIVMRPPVFRGRGVRGVAVAASKSVALLGCLALRAKVDVRFLDDPLGSGLAPVWKWPFNGSGPSLADPADLIGSGEPDCLPEEVEARHHQNYVALLGSIDERKRLPEIVHAWLRSEVSGSGYLLVAGAHSHAMREWWQKNYRVPPASILVLDRYLTNGEMLAVLQGSRGVLVLYDGGLSSGVLVGAARAGRWAICTDDSRTGLVAKANGFGVGVSESLSNLPTVLREVVESAVDPAPCSLPGRREFGLEIMRRCGATRVTQVHSDS